MGSLFEKISILFFLPLLSQAGSDRLLYIGDSHSYIQSLTPSAGNRRLGNALIEGLEKSGHEVFYFAACGSDPED